MSRFQVVAFPPFIGSDHGSLPRFPDPYELINLMMFVQSAGALDATVIVRVFSGGQAVREFVCLAPVPTGTSAIVNFDQGATNGFEATSGRWRSTLPQEVIITGDERVEIWLEPPDGATSVSQNFAVVRFLPLPGRKPRRKAGDPEPG